MRYFRFCYQREDAADGAELICHVTSYSYLHCPHCQQRQYGEPWDRCMFCNQLLNEEQEDTVEDVSN
jgi:hypothetical protein